MDIALNLTVLTLGRIRPGDNIPVNSIDKSVIEANRKFIKVS